MNHLNQEFHHCHHLHLQQYQDIRLGRSQSETLTPTPCFPENMNQQYRGDRHYHRQDLLLHLHSHLGRNHLKLNLSNSICPFDIGLHYQRLNRHRHHHLLNCQDTRHHHNQLLEKI